MAPQNSEISGTLGICNWRCGSGHGEGLVGGTKEVGPCSGHSRELATCSKHFNESWGLLNLTSRKQNAGSLVCACFVMETIVFTERYVDMSS